MSKPEQIVEQTLLAPAALDTTTIERVLNELASHDGVDYADLYFQYSRSESWQLDQSCVKSGSFGIDKGVGLRAVSGEKTAFAYSDDFDPKVLMTAAGQVKAIARQGQDRSIKLEPSISVEQSLYPPEDPLQSLDDDAKITLLHQVDRFAREQDPRVQEVMASLSGSFEAVLVARPDGKLVADVRPMTRLNVNVIVEQDGRRESGSAGGGGRSDYGIFSEQVGAGVRA